MGSNKYNVCCPRPPRPEHAIRMFYLNMSNLFISTVTHVKLEQMACLTLSAVLLREGIRSTQFNVLSRGKRRLKRVFKTE